MRYLFLIIGLAIAYNSWSQISHLPIQHSYTSQARLDSIVVQDTISLPFWDDFAASDSIDTQMWRYGRDVYINNTQSINSPSKNVASFDGINALGLPHITGSEFNGPGDSLVSQSINLSNIDEELQQTVYLSFYWQIKGAGDLPSPEDSLRLQFLREDTVWVTQDINPFSSDLSLTGGISNLIFDNDSIQTFTQVVLPLTRAYLHAGFQFKFEAFTSLNGFYDSWHIDYIYLNTHRSSTDVLHFDRTISGTQSPLLFPYTSIPVDQLNSNFSGLISAEQFVFNNLDNTPHPATYAYQIKEIVTGSSSNQVFITPQDMLPLEQGRVETIPNVILPALRGDSLILETEIVYLTGDKNLFEDITPAGDTLFLSPDLTINDTVRNRYVLHNYLAYDDGSAEIAAGINLNQGQLAVQFIVNEPDTLTDIQIYFPPIFPSTIGESITIKVWTELDNLALAREIGGVIEPAQRNQFQQFTLSTPLIVRDTFYIGFQQFTDNYIGIGLDKNSLGGSQRVYSNTNRAWDQNIRINGSLMMRPVFRSATEYVLSTSEKTPGSPILSFYPNPASSTISFSKRLDSVAIYSLSGRLIKTDFQVSQIDLNSIPSGIYLIKMQYQSTIQTKRLIIR